MAAHQIKRKHLRLMLKEVNSSSRTSAVLMRCNHTTGGPHGYVLLSIPAMLKHRLTYDCRPERITETIETIEAMELKSNGIEKP